MTLDKAKFEGLFREAHQWLKAFDEIKLRQSIQVLVQQTQEAIDRKDYAEAWCFFDQLKELADKIQSRCSSATPEPALMMTECALAAYRMGNRLEAVNLLKGAVETFDGKYHRHHEGAIKWMLGCVQWQIPNQRENAIASWESSLEIYQNLIHRSLDLINIRRATWYSERVTRMKRALEIALQFSEPVQPASPISSKPPKPAPSAKTSPVTSKPTPRGDFLRLFNVKREVSAGNFDSTGLNPDTHGYVEVDQLQINGCAHYLVNLRRDGRVINISPSQTYRVVKVKGESMTAEEIDDEDYVLLRIQNTAEHNDIVMAKIYGFDTDATLKKFIIGRNGFILRFRSNHPMYKEDDGRDKEFHFTGYHHDEFQIIGVAIAVFKPI